MVLNTKKISVTLKLPQLQTLIKKDPEAYFEEFKLQLRHFENELELFKLRPNQDSDRFTELVTFMSHVVTCYKYESTSIPQLLFDLLDSFGSNLHPDVRIKVFQGLILLRNKNAVEPLSLIKLCFKLLNIHDKTLREDVSNYILNDIKNSNLHKIDEKSNKSIQAFMYTIVADDKTYGAQKSVEILSELYRKKIWNDPRTVNVLGAACLSPLVRVSISAINFFLGIETKMFDDEEIDKAAANQNDINFHEHSKKTKKRFRLIQRQRDRNDKQKRDNDTKWKEQTPIFPAIQVINDPYSLAENIFKKLRHSIERFEIRLLYMNFISRLIGCHKLILLNFYSFLQKYLNSHQSEILKILSYLVQACHELIPPEEVLPILKCIAMNFITERCNDEIIAVGINTVKEILLRVPSVLHETDMDIFIQDIAMYSKKMHKAVMISARGVVNFVRDTFPSLLKKSDRGKFHDLSTAPKTYGDENVYDAVDGIDLLEKYEKGLIRVTNGSL